MSSEKKEKQAAPEPARGAKPQSVNNWTLLSSDSVFLMCIAAVLIALVVNGYTCSECSCAPPAAPVEDRR